MKSRACRKMTNQTPSEEVANAYQQACQQHRESRVDATRDFLGQVDTLLESARCNSGRFATLLRALRDYDVDESFSHLPVQVRS